MFARRCGVEQVSFEQVKPGPPVKSRESPDSHGLCAGGNRRSLQPIRVTGQRCPVLHPRMISTPHSMRPHHSYKDCVFVVVRELKPQLLSHGKA